MRHTRRLIGFAAALISLAGMAAAQDFTPDRTLIDKLERGDVMHVRDDNGGRMDLLSALMGASHAKCDALSPGFAKIATYVAYLGSDSETGKYPSREFTGMGLMAAIFNNDTTRTEGQESTFDAPWMIEPNGAAMLVIGAKGCNDPRFQTIVRNLFKTLDHHIAWHEQKLGARAPLMKQTVMPMRLAEWQTAVEQNVELPSQPVVEKQFAELESRRATYLDCVYGPLNPDSTGSTKMNFWNREVSSAAGDFLKVSRKHPLADLGDVALAACPANLADAQQKHNEARNLAMSKVDAASLPPVPAPLQLVLGQYYQNYLYVKQSWLDYQKSHHQTDLQHAIDTKVILLRSFGRPCRPGGENDLMCQVSRQLNEEFAEIPDGPTSSRVPNTRVPDLSMRGDPTARQAPPPSQQAPGTTTQPSVGDDAIPRGTALLVFTSEPIDLTDSSRTYRGRLARPAQFRGRDIAPADSEVIIKVSEPQPVGSRGMTSVSLTVESIVIDGKRVAITTQPVVQPFTVGRASRSGETLPSGTRLVFIVANPK
jgi:hypothetical protein